MGKTQPSAKVVLDPVLGEVLLRPDEVAVINSPLLQRLQNIRQLGAAARLVYPGATHSRLEHSLGVMCVASRMAKQLRLSEEQEQVVRLAGLLHDIGHSPFGHNLDLEDKKRWTTTALTKSEITDILTDRGYDPRELLDVILGRHRQPLLSQILSGVLDADRLDYLLRDSYHAGFAHHNINAYHLMRGILPLPSGAGIGIRESSVQDLYDFFLLRFMMYDRVYFHREVRIADLVASRVLSLLISGNEISRPEGIDEFQQFDDMLVWSRFRECRRQGRISRKSRMISDMLHWLLDRTLPSMVWERRFDRDELNEVGRMDEHLLVRRLADDLHLDEKRLFFDKLEFPSGQITVFDEVDHLSRPFEPELRDVFGYNIARAYVPQEEADRTSELAAKTIEKFAGGH